MTGFGSMQSTRGLVTDTHRIQIGIDELKTTLGFGRFRHRHVIDPGNQRVFLGVKMRGLPVPARKDTAQLLMATGVMRGSQSKTCDK